MKESTFIGYWTGYADAVAAYGYPLWPAIYEVESDWYEQDMAMLAAMNVI